MKELNEILILLASKDSTLNVKIMFLDMLVSTLNISSKQEEQKILEDFLAKLKP